VMTKGPYEAAAGAHALVMMTEWDAFRALDLGRIANVMAGDALVDLRNVYNPEDVAKAGLSYSGVGR